MSARSIWNGSITFGSVVVPVKLFSATEDRALRFREVRASDGVRIEHRRVGAESGDEIAYDRIEKAYDSGGKRVVLTKQEISAADGPRPKVIAIEQFARAAEIDPVFYDKPYHLGAQEGGEHAYRVLLAALERSERVGIGRFVLRTREQLVAVRPLQGALGLQTMRFDDELVDPKDLELPKLTKKPSEREVGMAGKLVEMLAGEWFPDEHEDGYREAVLQLIEDKREGRKIKQARRPKATGDDLAAALEASLEGGGRRSAKSSGSSKPKASADEPKAGAAKPRAAAKTKRKRKKPKSEKGGD